MPVYLLSHWDRAFCCSAWFPFSVVQTVCVCARFHPTHYDTVLSNVDIGTNLCCVDHTVLLDEDVVSDVQREERHSEKRGGERDEVQVFA